MNNRRSIKIPSFRAFLESVRTGQAPRFTMGSQPVGLCTDPPDEPQTVGPHTDSSGSLTSGRTSKHVKGKFQCNHCKKYYTRDDNLAVHLRTYHSDSQPVFECDECGKRFLRKPDLTRHRRVGDLNLQMSRRFLTSSRFIQGRSHTNAKYVIGNLHSNLLLLSKYYVTMTTGFLLTSIQT
jgi:uncharacterized Zn-finger protein